MKKIAFICPYFGKFPNHFTLWLQSVEQNKNCTWFIYTDDKTKYQFPKNVIVNYCTIEDLQKKFSKKLGFNCSLNGIKKLGDYKPLFGFLFEENIEKYDAWGHIDLNDSIYGDIQNFITDELIDRYPKIMCCGHMSIYNNNYENNRMFMKKIKNDIDYKKIFTDEKFYNFEEISKYSIATIYKQNNVKIKNMSDYYADISCRKYDMRLGKVNDKFTKFYISNERNMIFSWENGKIFRYKINKKSVEKKEYMYIHIKRRKLVNNISKKDCEKYLIYQDGFMDFEIPTVEFIRKHNKKKLIYKKDFFKKISKYFKR